jgi:hypothetical protein
MFRTPPGFRRNFNRQILRPNSRRKISGRGSFATYKSSQNQRSKKYKKQEGRKEALHTPSDKLIRLRGEFFLQSMLQVGIF